MFYLLGEQDENREHYETVLAIKKEAGHESSKLCFSRSVKKNNKKEHLERALVIRTEIGDIEEED